MKKMLIALAALCLPILASPAIADPGSDIVAVTVSKDDIAMPSLEGVAGADCTKPDAAGKGQACVLKASDNAAWFQGVEVCVSGHNERWAIRRDGSIVTDDPLRRLSCTPFNGSVPARRSDATALFVKGGRLVAWVGH